MSDPNTCPSCQDLSPTNDEGTRVSLIDVARSATAGCDGCRLIRHAINDCVPQALVPQNGRTAVDVVIRQAIMRHFVEVVVKFHGNQVVVLDLLVKPNTHNPWPSIRVGTPTSGNTISSESFQMVDYWLQKCKAKHESCKAMSTHINPKRVLDLNIVQPNVLLCEPPATEIQYVCLSHCWGDSRIITTTQESISAARSAITFETMPRTFQEAVIFTRKLGIRYLWIDSLCIIQDSEQDWQEQSAVMSRIYANSYVTLAATGSASDDGGLFSQHPKATIGGISRHGIDYQIHARPVIDHMDDAQFPLFKRAWVFQERLLAPRVLHFGRQELFWECNESVHCECGGIYGERYNTGQEKFLSKTTHQEAFQKQNLLHLRRRWHAIVEEYTQLSLTIMRDKLPALGGIAEQMAAQGERRGSYLAGLWSDTLPTDLLWYHQDAMNAKTIRKWRAPTWSWAGLEGQVRYFDAPSVQESPNTPAPNSVPSLRDEYLKVIDFATRAANPDNPFGEVLSAHLRLRGPLVRVAVFDSRSLSARTQSLPLNQRRRMVRRQTFRSAHYEFRFESSDDTDSYSFFADYDLQNVDITFNKSIFGVLRIGTDNSDEEYALVLKRIHEEQNIWERVGLFTTKFTRWLSNEHRELYHQILGAQDNLVEFTLV